MYGDLSMANHKIENVGAPAADKDVANKIYVDQAPLLPLAGGQMAGAIDMHDNEIVNVKDPVNTGDGVNKKYVDATHVDASGTGPQENPFKYLMEDVDESSSENNIRVQSITNFRASPHQINQSAYNHSR